MRGERADTIARLEERRTQAERALGYVELYGAYTETEARFRVDRLLALWARLSPADQEAFCFDPGVIDWAHYVREVHLPSVIEHARVRTTPGKSVVASRPERARKAILSADRHLAVFDLENTLIASNVVESYTWLASRHLPAGRAHAAHGPHPAGGARRCWPSTAATGATSCAASTAATRARRPSLLAQDAMELFHHLLLTKSFPAGIARVRKHKALGHRTVLITGALDFVVEPLAAAVRRGGLCRARAPTAEGRLTGRLDRLPPTGEARALVLAEYAAAEGLDLGESVAYADSTSDLPLLECVGLPGGGQPRGQAGRHRPPARLARRAVGQGPRRGPARAAHGPGRPRPDAAVGQPPGRARRVRRRARRRRAGARGRS